jgi:CBS domain-containing protein
VVQVREDSTFGEAFKNMIDHRILSVVVVNEEKRPISAFGLTHVISYLLKSFGEDVIGSKISSLLNDTEAVRSVSKAKISHVLQEVDVEVDPIILLGEDAPLMEAIELMLETRAHRIVVQDRNQILKNLITQSRIVSLVNMMEAPILGKSLQDLNVGTRNVVTIRNTETAYKGFQTMISKKISGLAVVNETGELLGNLSVADIKLVGWNADYWNLLGLSIKEYLQQLASHPKSVIRDYNFFTVDKPQNVILKVRPSDKLSDVVKMMRFFRVHRIYIVGEDKKTHRSGVHVRRDKGRISTNDHHTMNE